MNICLQQLAMEVVIRVCYSLGTSLVIQKYLNEFPTPLLRKCQDNLTVILWDGFSDDLCVNSLEIFLVVTRVIDLRDPQNILYTRQH